MDIELAKQQVIADFERDAAYAELFTAERPFSAVAIQSRRSPRPTEKNLISNLWTRLFHLTA